MREAFGRQQTDVGAEEVVEGPIAEYLCTEGTKDFFELMTESDKPLYPGINIVYFSYI